jgi:hypothetical protein
VAVVTENSIVVAWVGDSPVFIVYEDGSTRLLNEGFHSAQDEVCRFFIHYNSFSIIIFLCSFFLQFFIPFFFSIFFRFFSILFFQNFFFHFYFHVLFSYDSFSIFIFYNLIDS